LRCSDFVATQGTSSAPQASDDVIVKLTGVTGALDTGDFNVVPAVPVL
jgi:hypothetical protein